MFREENRPAGTLEPTALGCAEARTLFSDYLDGSLSGHEMQGISFHLQACPSCKRQFSSEEALRLALAGLRPLRAPQDLQKHLLGALAVERERGTHLDFVSRFRRDWKSSLAPMALRLSGGLLAAILLLGPAALFFADNLPVQANDDRLTYMVAPRYLYSQVPEQAVNGNDTLLVDAHIDERGRVYDYSLVAGEVDPVTRLQVEQNLLNSVFEPARLFGAPVRGHLLLTFSGVSVRA